MNKALLLTSCLSIAVAFAWLYVMTMQNNPERLTSINRYGEGWIETIMFFLIAFYGFYVFFKT